MSNSVQIIPSRAGNLIHPRTCVQLPRVMKNKTLNQNTRNDTFVINDEHVRDELVLDYNFGRPKPKGSPTQKYVNGPFPFFDHDCFQALLGTQTAAAIS
jgi:hypothetical protein